MAADSGHRAARYIRVFVSSTFSDLVREREALQAHVFPRLRAFCRQRGWRFEAIDLRWGVSREAGLDQRTMQICLHEIESCRAVSPRPNFIALLGERYGWRPLPEELPRALFERVRDALDSERRSLLEWRDDQPEGRKGWYRLDGNARLRRAAGHDVERGVYVLQPRTGPFTDPALWSRAVEDPLLEALSASAADWASAIGQSATEQEIRHGALAIPDAHDHVLCFQRRIVDETGRPMRDVMAAAHGVQVPDVLREMFDRTASGELDMEAAGRLSRLQGDLRRHIGAGNVHDYDVVWRDDGLDRGWVDPFCEEVTQRLQAIIRMQIDAFGAHGADPDGGTTHSAAGLERRRDFVGRAREREAIGRYIRGGRAETPFAVVGPAGSGKSALLAWAAEEARRGLPEAVVIERYIGATVESLLPSSLLGGLVAQIDRACGRDPGSVSSDPLEAADAFAERLELARHDRPLALFIDGVDRLQTDSDTMPHYWLPSSLPTGVRLVVSASRDGVEDAGAASTGRLLVRTLPHVALGGFAPSESRALLEAILDRESPRRSPGMAGMRRALTTDQWTHLLGSLGVEPTPRLVRLAGEAARRWRSWDERPAVEPSEERFAQASLRRMAMAEHHGTALVGRTCAYLLAARHGLTEDELIDLLSNDDLVWSEFLGRAHYPPEGAKRLPASVFVRLYRDLEPMLAPIVVDGAPTVRFDSAPTARAARALVVPSAADISTHAVLAGYFTSRSEPSDASDVRGIAEGWFHLASAGAWEALAGSLDFTGFEAYCRARDVAMLFGQPMDYRGVLHLIEDLDRFGRMAADRPDMRDRLSAIQACLIRISAAARTEPEHLAQHALADLGSRPDAAPVESDLCRLAEQHLRGAGRVFFRPQTRIPAREADRRVLSRSADFDLIAARRNAARFFCVETPGTGRSRLAIWDEIRARRVWTLEQLAAGSARTPLAARWLPDTETVLIVRANGEVSTADAATGTLHVAITLGRRLGAAAIDDRGIVFACEESRDASRLWVGDVPAGRVTAVTGPATGHVMALALAPGGGDGFVAVAVAHGATHWGLWRVPLGGAAATRVFEAAWGGRVTVLEADPQGQRVGIGTSAGGFFVLDAGIGLLQAAVPGFAERRRAGWLATPVRPDPTEQTPASQTGQGATAPIRSVRFLRDGAAAVFSSCASHPRMAPGTLGRCDIESGGTATLEDFPDGIVSLDTIRGEERLVLGGYAALQSAPLPASSATQSSHGPLWASRPGGAAWAPAGDRLAVAFGGELHVIEGATAKTTCRIQTGAAGLRGVRWDGGIISAVGSDDAVHVFDETGAALARYGRGSNGPSGRIRCYALPSRHPGVACLLAADGTVIVHQRDGAVRHLDLGHTIAALALSPSGRTCVVGLEEPACYAFSTDTWDLLGGHEGPSGVLDVAVPDEDRALVCYGHLDSEIVAWHTVSGREIERFTVRGQLRSAFHGGISGVQTQMFALARGELAVLALYFNGVCRIWRHGRPDPAGQMHLALHPAAAWVSAEAATLRVADMRGRIYSFDIEAFHPPERLAAC